MAQETDREMFERLWREVTGLMQRPDVAGLVGEVISAQRSIRIAKGKLFMLVGHKNGESLWKALHGRAVDAVA